MWLAFWDLGSSPIAPGPEYGMDRAEPGSRPALRVRVSRARKCVVVL